MLTGLPRLISPARDAYSDLFVHGHDGECRGGGVGTGDASARGEIQGLGSADRRAIYVMGMIT